MSWSLAITFILAIHCANPSTNFNEKDSKSFPDSSEVVSILELSSVEEEKLVDKDSEKEMSIEKNGSFVSLLENEDSIHVSEVKEEKSHKADSFSEPTNEVSEVEIHLTVNDDHPEVENTELLVKDGDNIIKSPSHETWNSLLQQFVSAEGVVDYANFKVSESELDEYLELLRSNPIQGNWSRNEKLSYWINAYNAFTIKLILKHYPVNSILNINSGKAWDLEWIQLGAKQYSLNEIENEIIRPQFKEPRIHFAVNCAAKSCPPLANEAFTPDNIEFLLEKQTQAFIQDASFNQIKKSSVKISKIFEWYGEDFKDLIGFLNKYSSTQINNKAKISYQEYNWDLNGK